MAKKEIHGIEIANPMYDVVFKRLMDNTHVASYFIETFIGEKVESLTLLAQETTLFKWSKKVDKLNLTPEELEQLKQLTVIRLDFVATVRTNTGEYKKVLIEIQKARDDMDVMRFRNYLAEHYKRKETVIVDGKSETVPLPIITIYLFGFNLPESTSIVFRVGRTYHDMIENKAMNVKISLAEYLTHDCYIVQLGRITGKMKTRLERVLSVFEQRYFIDSKKKITKKYPHVTDDKNVRLMLEILEHACADPEQRADIEREWLSLEVLNSFVTDRDKKLKALGKKLIAKEKAYQKSIEAKDKAYQKSIEAKDKAYQKSIEAKDKELEAKDKELAELKKRLGLDDFSQ